MEVNYVELSRLWEKQYHLMKNDKEQLEQENAKLKEQLDELQKKYEALIENQRNTIS